MIATVSSQRCVIRVVSGSMRITHLCDDTVAITYGVHEDLVVDGKPVQLDAFDASVWKRTDTGWTNVLHTESIPAEAVARDRLGVEDVGPTRVRPLPDRRVEGIELDRLAVDHEVLMDAVRDRDRVVAEVRDPRRSWKRTDTGWTNVLHTVDRGRRLRPGSHRRQATQLIGAQRATHAAGSLPGARRFLLSARRDLDPDRPER